MHLNRTLLCLLYLFTSYGLSYGQGSGFTDSIPAVKSRVTDINPRKYQNNDSVWIYSGICKPLKRIIYNKKTTFHTGRTKTSLLKVHGNVQYDFLYRSLIDTPFYQPDFSQHSVKTNFTITIRGQLPVRATLLHRNSNSPYFRDITDLSIQFVGADYLQHVKRQISMQAETAIRHNFEPSLRQMELKYQQQLSKVTELEQWLASPARLQELTEARERALKVMAQPDLPKAPGIGLELPVTDTTVLKELLAKKLGKQLTKAEDSLLKRIDSLLMSQKKQAENRLAPPFSAADLEKKKAELAAAKIELQQYEQKAGTVKKRISNTLAQLKREIASLRDEAAVKQYIRDKQISTSQLPKGWRTVTSLQTIGIGRTWVDYSELTVKNISLTGVNAEANSGSLYFAVAAGKINYRYRDFVMKDHDSPRQSLYLARAGIGRKAGNHFILTWYDGKRTMLNPAGSPLQEVAPTRVLGMSAETRIQLNERQFIIAEFAKSSFQYAPGSTAETGLFNKVKDFSDRSNEAYSLRFQSYWPAAGTKLSGFYKRTGDHFQSFTLQPLNNIQESFHIKGQQQLWRKRFIIDAAVRKNDFINPYINPGISSQTVFTSLQLSLRIPKYPFVSIGYAPSSQLTVLDNQRLAENQYRTLHAVASYSYQVKAISMASNAMFLKFYNHSPDTGFIYYNASSFSFSQTFYLKGWDLQSSLSITDQQELSVTSLEQTVSYQPASWLSLSGGIKYHLVPGQPSLWGASSTASFNLNRLGMIRLFYDKSYLPGTNRNLLPVQSGNISFYRTF